MLRSLIAASIALVAMTSLAEARDHSRHRYGGLHPECNVTMPCAISPKFLAGVRSINIGLRREKPRRGLSTSSINATLSAKVAEIVAACPGAHVISAVRHTRIAGTRRMSLHASGNAVDMQGNPSCIYAHLRGWPGGYSTDYSRVRHVHISYDAAGGREMGLRFAHGGGHKHRRRLASR